MTLRQKIGINKEKPLILYAALDWGLGHTTRSIALIRRLLAENCHITIACNTIQKRMFETEFPMLEYRELDGYEIQYGRSGLSTLARLWWQVPKILTKIKSEKRWLAAFLAENPVDLVISDNRYGFSHPSVPTVFITHQLQVISGLGKVPDRLAQKLLYRFINCFTQVWVPDYERDGLAGKLSHPKIMPSVPVHYIGPLSRMQSCPDAVIQYRYCFILSGPEPQRSIFEKMVLQHLPPQSVLVRGLPHETALPDADAVVINYADAHLLNQLVCASETIVCRSGYTSMMELLPLGKRILVVPTPGQTEQEYLARYLAARGRVELISSLPFA